MNDDFERCSLVLDGYFYTFTYDAKNKVPGYDREPFIYCLGPYTNNANCFVGINLHHLPTDERVNFLLELERLYHILNNEERSIVDAERIKTFMPSAKLALRVYDRRRILNCYRVKNCAVGKYIEYNGGIYMKEPTTIMNKYWLNYVHTKTAKSEE